MGGAGGWTHPPLPGTSILHQPQPDTLQPDTVRKDYFMGFFGHEHDEQVTRARMMYDDKAHTSFDVLRSFDATQLDVLQDIFMMISSSPDSATQAAWYVGWVTARLESEFGLCPVHHVNHDTELDDLASGTTPTA